MAIKRRINDSVKSKDSAAHAPKPTKLCKTTSSSLNAKLPDANWNAMKAKIQVSRKALKKCDLNPQSAKTATKLLQKELKKESMIAKWIKKSDILAMDCEMVGVGTDGRQDALARCSIIDFDGNVLFDRTVSPVEKVTDYRTRVSGIRPRSFKNAISFSQCLKEVGALLKDKIVVGHALKNDFQALMLSHPKRQTRDTARYRPYMRYRKNGTKLLPRSLKTLAAEFLKRSIQEGEHDSVEDARAALELYKRQQFDWEKYLQEHKVCFLAGRMPPVPSENTIREEKSDPKSNQVEPLLLDAFDTESGVKPEVRIPDTNTLALMEYDA
ncbi:unnamed protein product [Albugo candida]|uniref:RNA exonuclease 4 n=2 Tax=Albugo candida TaxID=65357 RepID=A0A024GQY3_9STRA|nr:unnamed protein product [Albugo candida]|eukprot:CCI48773.1 unnamed protein product [Albugo candida]